MENNNDNIQQLDSMTKEIMKNIQTNILYRFETENDNTYDEEKKLILKKVLLYLNKKTSEEYDTKQANKDKLNNFLDKMTNNKMKTTWTRLNYDQKLSKLEEFINNEVTDDKKKKIIMKKIKTLLDKGKLNTAKEINYDKDNCKINNIKCWDDLIENI
jgi:hypothetical protein